MQIDKLINLKTMGDRLLTINQKIKLKFILIISC